MAGRPLRRARAALNNPDVMKHYPGAADDIKCEDCSGTGTEDGLGTRICLICKGAGKVAKIVYYRYASGSGKDQDRITKGTDRISAKKNPIALIHSFKAGDWGEIPGVTRAYFQILGPAVSWTSPNGKKTFMHYPAVISGLRRDGVYDVQEGFLPDNDKKYPILETDLNLVPEAFKVSIEKYRRERSKNNPVWITPEGNARARRIEEEFDAAYDNPRTSRFR